MPFKKFDVDKAIVEKFGSKEEFDKICEKNKKQRLENLEYIFTNGDEEFIKDMYEDDLK